MTRPSPRLSGPDQPTSTQKLPAAALTAFVATLQAPWFPLPPGTENQGANCERLIFFLTRPSPRLSGPDQPTSTQKLPAAALTAFVATLQAPWFPLPPGTENQGENCERLIFFFDEAVAKTFWPRSVDFDAEASCSCLDSLRSNVAGAVVSIASRYRKSGGKLRTPNFFFLTRPSPRLSGPDQPTSTQKLPAAALTAFVATLQAPWFPLPPGTESQGENCERLIFFLTRPSSRLSGPDQPTSMQKLPAAALTAFVATLQAPWFPLPPGTESQGENCEHLIFFFDEAVAKTFWLRSADFDAEASCSCLDSFRSNVAGAVVSIASRYRKSGGKLRTPNFFF